MLNSVLLNSEMVEYHSYADLKLIDSKNKMFDFRMFLTLIKSYL